MRDGCGPAPAGAAVAARCDGGCGACASNDTTGLAELERATLRAGDGDGGEGGRGQPALSSAARVRALICGLAWSRLAAWLTSSERKPLSSQWR